LKFVAFVLSLNAAAAFVACAQAADLAPYNIIWTNQSVGAVDSMPLAGGVLGLNVWVENNDLLFLIGSPNCLNEEGMQTKLGLLRLRLSPAVFSRSFRQELDLEKSEVRVAGETPGGQSTSIRLWCDVNQPVIHAELASGEPLSLQVSYETWSNYEPKFVPDGLQWMHRLPEVNQRRLRDMKAQGMEEFASSIPDPLSHLTEGGRLVGHGLEPAGTSVGSFQGMATRVATLKSARPVDHLALSLVLRMEQDASVGEWEEQLVRTVQQVEHNQAADRAATLAWWKDFWNRSYLIINPGAEPADKPWQAGRNYQLSRYQLAANRNGRAMTLFNGGVFPCTGNPDSRNWDGCQFMGQNQRLVYWPMLRSGDFDLLQVALDFYRDRAEASRLHAKKFWGVDGIAWPEPFSIFGLDAIGTTADGRSKPDHLHYHYTSGMEFALMMLEFGSYSGQAGSNYTAAAEGILAYYDQFYQQSLRKKTGQPLDAKGHLVIYPSDACEPYHGCTNNTDVLAGLHALSRALLDLPAGALPPQRQDYVRQFQKRIPPFPIKTVNGKSLYGAAESWEWVFQNGNMDFPQMYVCFPFNIARLGQPEIELARNTWDLGALKPQVQRQNQCWYQSAINLARLGRTAEAARFTLQKLLHPGARFPTFYRTHYAGGQGEFCHLPDTDHGGAAMLALQEMLMQTDGKRILLGPAWPAEWDCEFKLHAPYQTTVEGRVAGGRVVVTRVIPPARQADIEILPLTSAPLPLSEGRTASAESSWGGGYEAAKAVDGDADTRWAAAPGHNTGWLEVDLGAARSFSSVLLDEWAAGGQRIQRYELQRLEGGSWKAFHQGTTIGPLCRLSFLPVTARRVRLNILAATAAPTLNEFQILPR
jgi:hypothetical protein